MGPYQIDYPRLEKAKAFSVAWAAMFICVGLVFSVVDLIRPASRWITHAVYPLYPHPLLSAVRTLARQTQTMTLHPTAVRLDDWQAESCAMPTLGPSQGEKSRVTPIPFLEEFIISERTKKICLVVSELTYQDIRASRLPAYSKFQTSGLIENFGNVQDGLPMFRRFSVKFDLSGANLERLTLPGAGEPALLKFYQQIPRMFSQSERGAANYSAFTSQEALFYSRFMKEAFGDAVKEESTIRQILALAASLNLIGILFCYHFVWQVYGLYRRDMLEQERGVLKFRSFVAAVNVMGLQERIEDVERQRRREATVSREQAKKRRRFELRPVTQAFVPKKAETRAEIDARRRSNINRLCNEFDELCTDEQEQYVLRIWTQASNKVDRGDYEGARKLLAEAISAQKAALDHPQDGFPVT